MKAVLNKGLVLLLVISIATAAPLTAHAQAGLLWGPHRVGNLELKVTNPHSGYAGPKVGTATHVNFVISTDNGRGHYSVQIANYHFTKYTTGGKQCVYVWDSVSGQVVFDGCSNNWTSVAKQSVEAMHSFTQTVLSQGNWVVYIAVYAVIAAVLIDVIVPLDPIPIIPFEPEPSVDGKQAFKACFFAGVHQNMYTA